MIQLKKITELIREKYQSVILGDYNGEQFIHHVEFITPHTLFDDETLYLCSDPKKLGHTLPSPTEFNNVYIITSIAECEKIPSTFNTICFSKLPDIHILYNDIHTLIKEEAVLEHQIRRLYESLYHGGGLKGIIAKAEEYLKHPINVCDSSYKFIETSPLMKKFPYGISGSNSNLFLGDKEIESLKRNNFEAMIYQKHSAFFITSPDYPDQHWIFCAIRVQNVMIGYVAIAVSIGHSITDYELRFTTALADVCAVQLQHDDSYAVRTGSKYETFLTDLLEGQFHDINMIQNRMELLDRKFCKYFCIMVLKSDDVLDKDLFNKRQLSNLRYHYPNSMSVVYKDTIVLFLNQDVPISPDKNFASKIEEFARLNHMHVGISQPFVNILKIHTYYKQALHTLELGMQMGNEETLLFAADLFPHFLFQNCEYAALETGIHHHLLQLQEYDDTYHTEFIVTLRAYLNNDRNAAKTSEYLHIHRSTLFYRIKKIEEILDISFTDSKLMFLYELSFKVMDYIH